MDNSLILGIPLGILLVAFGAMAMILFMGYSRNQGRYDIPKYLPRDDERAWAIAMASAKRLWSLRKCKYITYENWDLGVVQVDNSILSKYETKPRFGDVILVPKKWGGLHACVITRELDLIQHPAIGNIQRFITVYLGEFDAKQFVIYDGRDRTRTKVIQ